jgi:hypothetical protein
MRDEVVPQATCCSKVAHDGRGVPYDESFDLRTGRFDVVSVDPVVSDVWISESDDLAPIGGVGQNLLISCQTGVENDFAGSSTGSANRRPGKPTSVF